MSRNETTIRLTNFCNETCEHCVFRSGPSNKVHLTEKMSQQLNEWLPQCGFSNVSIMGGEVSLIPNYPKLIHNVIEGHWQAGVLTNGVFVKKQKLFDQFVQMVLETPVSQFTVRVSQSQYHSDELYGEDAFKKLKEAFKHHHGRFIQLSESLDIIVPMGRAFDNDIDRWPGGAACESCCKNSIFIDEHGMVHWCPLGESPYKHFSECEYEEARREILEWRREKVDRGMNCLSCSENGIGDCEPEPTQSRVRNKMTCMAGGYDT